MKALELSDATADALCTMKCAPAARHRADALALSTAAMAVIKLVPTESSTAADSLRKAVTDGCAELAKFCT